MKRREAIIEAIVVITISTLMTLGIIYPFKFLKLANELDSSRRETIELRRELELLEKENNKLNFEKSLERTCGLESVVCENE